MRRSLVVLAIGIGLVLAGMADAETIRKKIKRNNDLVYVWTANQSNASRITTMWDKASADVDVYAGSWDSSGSSFTIASSEATTDGLEVLEFGVLENADYWVILHLFVGSSTKLQMNVSTASFETVNPFGDSEAYDGLEFVGVLQDLAATDEGFASILQEMDRRYEEKAKILGN